MAEIAIEAVRENGLEKVVEVESPIHKDEASRRVATAWGVTRLSRGIQKKIAEAVARLQEKGEVRSDGDGFLWKPDDQPLRPRVRRSTGDPREAELISLEEVTACVQLILEREYRLQREDLVTRAARLFGFTRAGRKLRERIGKAIDRLIGEERAIEDETGVRRK